MQNKSNKGRKSQMTIEFLIVVGLSIAISFGFLMVFSDVYKSILNDRRNNLFEDFGRGLQIEVNTAAQMKSGFEREIDIPEKLSGFEYDISLVSDTLVVEYENGVKAFIISNITGAFVKGINTIKNVNGTACLNC